jgi:hypothetical protein
MREGVPSATGRGRRLHPSRRRNTTRAPHLLRDKPPPAPVTNRRNARMSALLRDEPKRTPDLKTPRWKAATVDSLAGRREELAAALDDGALLTEDELMARLGPEYED